MSYIIEVNKRKLSTISYSTEEQNLLCPLVVAGVITKNDEQDKDQRQRGALT